MQNPFQQATGANLNDPLAFVKKLWGDMQLPGMVTPTLSVDELDKQIKDLKTVESWLNVNMNMLKGTIQALEVQRATISALKTMGESFAQAGNVSSSSASAASAQAANSNHTSWPMHGNSHSASTTAVPEPSVEENEEEELPEDEAEPDAELAQEQEQRPKPKAEPRAEQTNPASTTSQEQSAFHNPAAWWTVLQDQFKQALSHAMKDEETTASDEQPKQTQAKRVAKTSTAKAGTGTKPRATPAKSAAVKAKATSSPASKGKSVAKKASKVPTKSTVKNTAKTRLI
ncbi:PhaM family polyhydroxyalkanoate granule multifunctional regulatory protein [Undibacterium flavidum]|uniref:Tfp pilus assembly protein FimV n=1 Tax=Undibacterium flavidum TaxID=2762297 RepID=A0ABR6YAW1_9BURK|nr:PhaM family polyhydroxyalkanoate granule multifunctional regulatory protein [Undibacterium flavidum]MBC3873690.1 hypothetical protein [Undibacterium flavidum]